MRTAESFMNGSVFVQGESRFWENRYKGVSVWVSDQLWSNSWSVWWSNNRK